MGCVKPALFALLAGGSPVAAQSAPPSWFSVARTAVYQTGDSWTDSGTLYRLYGVQSCLRRTSFTNSRGLNRDCGEVSLAMLIALVRDLNPQCYPAAALPERRTVFVFCIAPRVAGSAAGSRIDLGTALIATGYGFAALRPDGSPVHAPYLVAQHLAQREHAGLWAYADLPDPNAIIARALRTEQSAARLKPPASATNPIAP